MSKTNFGGSNLVKSYMLSKNDSEPLVIDSNSLIEEKLERIRYIMPEVTISREDFEDQGEAEFVGGLDATMLDALTGDSSGLEEFDEEGNPITASNVIKAMPAEYEEPVYDGPTPEELIAEAEEQIALMKNQALDEIERSKAAGYEEGKNQGYTEGRKAAEVEMSRAWNQIENAKRELEEAQLQMIAELEPRFINTITSVYEKVFEVKLSEDKGIVTSIIHNTLCQIESCKNYLIHVSRDDHQYVVEHKDELITLSMPDDVAIDIVEDLTLKTGDCMIETSSGIYDCGLGTQMASLKSRLELLSYTP